MKKLLIAIALVGMFAACNTTEINDITTDTTDTTIITDSIPADTIQ